MEFQGTGYSQIGAENPYKYSGKEKQADFNLDIYDFGARGYDPQIARFMQVDPLEDKTPNWTPYRYCFNNPIRYIDPSGMTETHYYSEDGKELANTNDGHDGGIVIPKKDEENFVYNVSNAPEENKNSEEFRKQWESIALEDGGIKLSPLAAHTMSSLHSDESRVAQLNMIKNPTFDNTMAALWAEYKAQWSDKALVAGNILAGVTISASMVRGDAVGGEIVEVENSPYLIVEKGNKTFHISPDRVKEYVRNPINTTSRWGDQINFKKYGVPRGSKIIQGAGKGHKRTPTKGELKMFNEYFKD